MGTPETRLLLNSIKTNTNEASISVIILGTNLGWPSPVLLRMEETGEPFQMSGVEVSWMVSLIYLGNFMSPIPAGFMMDRFGRKFSLLVLTVIPLSVWIIIYYAQFAWMLYIARFLAGNWIGIVGTIAPTYLAEISEPGLRGALSTFFQMMTNVGALMEYSVGPRVTYKELAIISGVFPVIFIFSLFYVPESPYWQVMKNKKEKAEASLAWLRGYHVPREVKEELDMIENAVQNDMKNKKRMKDLFATKGNKKALLMVEVLALLQRMSGISALTCYTSTTLPKTGFLSPNDCVVVMGVVWVVSVFVATILVDSLGRKPLLLISTLGCSVFMFFAGLWFYLDEVSTLDVSEFNWVPFASFIGYGVFFSTGFGPIVSTIQGEAFPSNIKGLASGISTITLALTSFTMNLIYHSIASYFGMYLNYWIFSGASIVAFVFVIFYVVETKGKTLHEIHAELNKSTKKNINNNCDV